MIMPSRIDKVNRVVSGIDVQMLGPRIKGIAGVSILIYESACLGVVEPCVHVLKPGRLVCNAARKCYFIEEARRTFFRNVPELVVLVSLHR